MGNSRPSGREFKDRIRVSECSEGHMYIYALTHFTRKNISQINLNELHKEKKETNSHILSGVDKSLINKLEVNILESLQAKPILQQLSLDGV